MALERSVDPLLGVGMCLEFFVPELVETLSFAGNIWKHAMLSG